MGRTGKQGLVCLLALVLFGSFLAFGVPPSFPVYGYRDTVRREGRLLAWGEGAYEMGENLKGLPIFLDPGAAFLQVQRDLPDGFALVREEFDLEPLSAENYFFYGTYGWQATCEDDALQDQCREISGFFDIYENSFPPPESWYYS